MSANDKEFAICKTNTLFEKTFKKSLRPLLGGGIFIFVVSNTRQQKQKHFKNVIDITNMKC